MKYVIGLVVVIGIALAVFYLVSDPFRTRMDTLVEDQTTWTDENIAEDPEGYLRWSLREFDSIEQALRGRQVNLRTQQNSLQRRQEADALQLGAVRTKLDELRAAYRAADGANRWPATVGDLSVSQDELRTLILDADGRIVRLTENERRYGPAVRKVEADLNRVDETLGNLRERRTEVGRQLEQLKLETTITGLGDMNDRINALLDTSRALRSEPQTISLDDLLIEDSGAVQQRRFDEVMGGN
jgi:chromosome segregation ATPase